MGKTKGKKGIPNDSKEFFHTKIVRDSEEAVEEKKKQLQGKFLGRPIVKFQIESQRDVWIPYAYLVYDFRIRGVTTDKTGRAARQGKVALVYDLNETHPMQYDIYENGDLPLVKASKMADRVILKEQISERDMCQQCESHIQMRIMKRFYGREADLKLVKKIMFFRPAVEMNVIYRKENLNQRYAYLDEFGIQSEHILGLKYRVENKS